jgi:hypothetical protein
VSSTEAHPQMAAFMVMMMKNKKRQRVIYTSLQPAQVIGIIYT